MAERHCKELGELSAPLLENHSNCFHFIFRKAGVFVLLADEKSDIIATVFLSCFR